MLVQQWLRLQLFPLDAQDTATSLEHDLLALESAPLPCSKWLGRLRFANSMRDSELLLCSEILRLLEAALPEDREQCEEVAFQKPPEDCFSQSSSSDRTEQLDNWAAESSTDTPTTTPPTMAFRTTTVLTGKKFPSAWSDLTDDALSWETAGGIGIVPISEQTTVERGQHGLHGLIDSAYVWSEFFKTVSVDELFPEQERVVVPLLAVSVTADPNEYVARLLRSIDVKIGRILIVIGNQDKELLDKLEIQVKSTSSKFMAENVDVIRESQHFVEYG